MSEELQTSNPGFAAAAFSVLRLEDAAELDRVRAALVSTYRPVNALESLALERIAIAQQSILRAARLESGLFTCCLNHTLSRTDRPFIAMDEDLIGELEVTRQQNRNYALALGFQNLAQSKAFIQFLRYQAQAERQYRRAVEDFQRIRAESGGPEPARAEQSEPGPRPGRPKGARQTSTPPIPPAYPSTGVSEASRTRLTRPRAPLSSPPPVASPPPD